MSAKTSPTVLPRPRGQPVRSRLGTNEKVALVGLVSALVTLAFTVFLRQQMLFARQVQIPIAVIASRMQTGIIASSNANARWVAFGDEDAKAERELIWSELIVPSMASLDQLIELHARAKGEEKAAALHDKLRRLEAVQWEIEQVAFEPGDLPAKARYFSAVEPTFGRIDYGLNQIYSLSEGVLQPKALLELGGVHRAVLGLDRDCVRLIAQPDPAAQFQLQRRLEAVAAGGRVLNRLCSELKTRSSLEQDIKQTICFLADEVRAIQALVQPLTVPGTLALERRSERLAREELVPLSLELQEEAAESAKRQAEMSLASVNSISRFGAGVVGLALIMGLTSAGSLYTSLRMRHRMDEVLQRAQKLGQYAVENRLGGGSMGEVYRARHALLRRPTAIKVLKPEGGQDLQAQARFREEVQITSLLTHPNTVQVYDYGRTPEGLFYYAMELLDGVDLETLVDQTGPVPPSRAVQILRQVCGSLAEAHRQGLLHRDIKPSNIMLTERGLIPDVVKVLDFGLARHESIQGSDSEIVGTPAYMAPEIIAEGHFDPRTDIYALGCVAYQLLTGTPPFLERSVQTILQAHLQARPPPMSERLGRPLPEDLEAVVMACLEKEPARRPPSAEALDHLLREIPAEGWTEDDARRWWLDHKELMQVDGPSSLRGSIRLERGSLS